MYSYRGVKPSIAQKNKFVNSTVLKRETEGGNKSNGETGDHKSTQMFWREKPQR